jgi:8-amino-7-oxononanoate synthase
MNTVASYAELPGLDVFRRSWNNLLRLLDATRGNGFYQYLEPNDGGEGAYLHFTGSAPRLNLASNDYLGLARHPAVLAAAIEAVRRHGTSSSSSPILSGYTSMQRELEVRLAALAEQEAALLFPSGYQGNLGVISALAGPGDAVFVDRLAHASIIDGVRLSGATLHVFPHDDAAALERMLDANSARRRLVVVEAVYSMDGDRAGLAPICEAARRHRALVMVDEAHSFGLVGKEGGGAVAAAGLAGRVAVVYGTLGKALAGQGAFIAGRRELIDWVRHRSRAYIFSTAPAPAVIGASLAALDLIRREPERREHLWRLVACVHERLRRAGLRIGTTSTPITPLLPVHSGIRGAVDVSRLGLRLRAEGIAGQVIVPPAVPQRTARIRLQLRADLTLDDADRLIETLIRLAPETGFIEAGSQCTSASTPI